MAIISCAEVKDGNLCFGVSFDDEGHDVAAEEAAAAYDEDFSERRGVGNGDGHYEGVLERRLGVEDSS